MEEKTNLSRRDFLKGAGAAGAVAVASATTAGLAGCSPSQAGTPTTTASNGTGEIDEHIAPGMRATPNLENAQPIPPEDPPSEWTAEADLVIVGTGGGGLAAALLGCERGASVIVVEKEGKPGGSTQHANGMTNFAGTGSAQKEKNFGNPEFPYNREYFLRWLEPNFKFSIDDDLIGNVVEASGECFDWMQEHDDNIVCAGVSYQTKAYNEGKVHKCLAVREITDKFYELGTEAGADFHFSTPCSALITENGRVVGIRATGPEGDVYYKANKGVILCSGGIGMNPDMLKKYIPTAYNSCVMGGPMPYHTGECTRMGLGVGGTMAGIDSWNAWECELDNDAGEWVYFWGIRQFFQMGWLNIDVRGKRCNYYEWDQFNSGDPIFTQKDDLPYWSSAGDRARFGVQASRIGHRAYCVFDNKYEDYVWKIANPPHGERRPITPEDPIPEQNLFDTDWHVEFDKAVADGRIKKADTLEELAEQLGLRPEVLTQAVDQWNDNCAKGVDSGTLYPVNKEFLNPIVEPPFYGAKMGPRLAMAAAGLRVDENLRVVDELGDPIPGLYANFSTAGGINGESMYGAGNFPSSVLGGCNLSWSTGYFAARTALSD